MKHEKRKDKKSVPIGSTEPLPALIYNDVGNSKPVIVPDDGLCIYCGEPQGTIWLVDGVPICGHCHKKYTRKGVDVW